MMDNQLSFETIEETVASNSVNNWYMVTNQRNFFYMLGAGLLMPPSGFGGKHYQDTFSCFPGWLPIFPNQVPKATIEFSIREKNHLIPCVLEISLNNLKGPAKAVCKQGNVRDIEFPEGFKDSDAFVLLLAPLPVTWLKSAIFETKERKIACEKDASDFDNVGLSDVSIRVLKSVFSKTTELVWPPQIAMVPEVSVPLEKPLAAGGIMAMLARLGNKSDLAIYAASLAFDRTAGEDTPLDQYRIIAAVKDWFGPHGINDEHGTEAKLYWQFADRLIEAREEKKGLSPTDVLLATLQQASADLPANAKPEIDHLIEDLRGIVGLGNYTVTTLFDRHKKPLRRAMLMFFLRENCTDLLNFSSDQINHSDYLSAAMLFGVRERWLGLPLSLREMPGLKEACCHRMAAMAHDLAGTNVNLGEPPARPRSLRELFRYRPWKKAQIDAALMIARKCAWDCIQTRVSLGRGEYKLEIDGHGVHFVLDGEPKAVKTEADYDAVLKHLALEPPIPLNVEIIARELLGVKLP